jgi:hypothetical protein
MKYNIGDLIVETCFKYKSDWKTGTIMEVQKDILPDIQLVGILWFDLPGHLDYYKSDEIDRWISRNNAKHYSVKR